MPVVDIYLHSNHFLEEGIIEKNSTNQFSVAWISLKPSGGNNR